MILTAEERVAVTAVDKLLNCSLVVCVVLLTLCDRLHAILVAGHNLHDISNDICVIGVNCAADPCTAPIVSLRSCAGSPLTVTAVSFNSVGVVSLDLFVNCIWEKSERNSPCGEEVTEYSAVDLLTGCPSVIPERSLVVVALICILLGLVNPSLDLRIDSDLIVSYPRCRNVI